MNVREEYGHGMKLALFVSQLQVSGLVDFWLVNHLKKIDMGKTERKDGTDGNIIEFLCGSHSFDGVWFGENHPTEEGRYWWRSHLRAYMATRIPEYKPKKK